MHITYENKMWTNSYHILEGMQENDSTMSQYGDAKKQKMCEKHHVTCKMYCHNNSQVYFWVLA